MKKCLYGEKYPNDSLHCIHGNDKCCQECEEQTDCDRKCVPGDERNCNLCVEVGK